MKYLRLLILLICAAFSFSMSAEVPASATYSLSPGETKKIYNNWLDDYNRDNGFNLRWELHNQDALQIVEQSNSYCVVKATNMLNSMIGRLYLKWDYYDSYGKVTAVVRFDFQYKAIGDVEINSTNFPDANFRNYLLAQSYGKDGVLIYSEIKNVTIIYVPHISIKSLKGIEIFTELTWLDCSYNQLTALDVSKNTALKTLDCYNNQLTALDVSKNTALKALNCSYNQLTALDVSKNTELTELVCYWNKLTTLNVSMNTALKSLDCFSNQLTALNVSKSTALTKLSCDNNQLTVLDVSKNTALTELSCTNNQLTALDVSKSTALTELYCSNNQLTALDVSKSTALTELYCRNNQLTSLVVSKSMALKKLSCENNKIKGVAMDALIGSLPQNTTNTKYTFTVINISGNTNEGNVCTKTQVAAAKAKGWTVYAVDGIDNVEYEGNEESIVLPTAIQISPTSKTITVGESFYASYTLTPSNATTTVTWSSDNTSIATVTQSGQVTGKKAGSTYINVTTANGKTSWFKITVNDPIVLPTAIQISPTSKTITVGESFYASYTLTPSNATTTVTWSSDDTSIATVTQSGQVTGKKAGSTYINVTTANGKTNWFKITVIQPIEINASNFPDDNFRSYLLSQSYGSDGKLMESEIKNVTSIDVENRSIKSLKGIEYFTALIYLACDSNQITALDVSKNTALKTLYCYENQLTALDVSKNTALTTLGCSHNQLTALDVSNNTALTWLNCGNNQLTALDVSKNTALTTLGCGDNQLTALDVSKNTALKELYCYENQLTALDVSNTALTLLSCFYNQLTVLDVSTNTALETLSCSNNQLTALDVSNNTALTWLNCGNNQLSVLDLSKNTALKELYCSDNQLTSLDVSNNTALTLLNCGNNQLTTLDMSNNTALKKLYCHNNQLTTLDVSKNTELEVLYCCNNRIKGAYTDAFIGSLPQHTTTELHVVVFIDISDNATEGNVCTKAQVAAANAKGWAVFAWDGENSLPYEGSDEAPAPTASLTMAETSIQQGEDGLLSIGMDNENEIIMAEFYMQLPEGITIAKDEDGYFDATLNRDRADRTHTLEVEQGSDGLYHFLAYSSKNKAFTGSEGELISVRLNCADDVEAGEYQGILKNILLSDANKNAIELNDMPFSITVVDYIMGDVNNDRRINGMDIVEMVELVMGQGYAKAADLYPVGQPDGKINGMDLVEEVELVMSQTASVQAQARMMANAAGGLTLSSLPNGALALGVTTSERYMMTQFVVHLDDGMTLNDVTTDAQHAVAWKQTGEQSYIVVAYSDRNRAFITNDALLSLHCTGEGTVTVTNVLMADEQRQECHFASVRSAAVAGIADVKGEDLKDVGVVYDLQGRRISTLPRKKGVYVVDGHKVMR